MAITTALTAPVAGLKQLAQAASSTMHEDDDEIVYPVSSQSNSTSASPAHVEELHADTVESRRAEHTNETNDDASNSRHGNKKVGGNDKGDLFFEDFVLERGDAGSKMWTPPPSVPRNRARGRGHRSTKSESSLPAAPTLREVKTALQPVKESWVDDVKELEEQMARAKLSGMTAGPGASQALHSPTSTPRRQRSQKKQKGARRPRGASVPANRPTSSNANVDAGSYPSPAPSPTPDKQIPSKKAAISTPESPTKKKPKKGKNKNKAKKDNEIPQSASSTTPSTPRGLGRRSIVDDISENGDVALLPHPLVAQQPIQQSETDRLLGIAYDEAVKFMNDFIENPDYYTSRASRLTFLQALIVELGLVSSVGPERTLPGSLSAAKAMLKSHAFLNVRDYLTLREKGVDALRSAMRPSRSALVRDLRGRNGRKAKLNWVKDTGLSVLLVSCQY